MKMPSLEEIAERWSLAHTIATAAWVVVLVLGLVLLARGSRDPYPTTDKLKVYAAENATFRYPANWTINSCLSGRHFIELPGTIKTDFKGRKAYPFDMYGTSSYICIKGRPERLDIYPEVIVASDAPCAPVTSTQGEKLENGLYLQLEESEGEVLAINIKQNSCYAPYYTFVLSFGFTDPTVKPEDQGEVDSPRVKKETLLASKQYQDIRTLAESIRY